MRAILSAMVALAAMASLPAGAADNMAVIEQWGEGNHASQQQIGDGNRAEARQTGEANLLRQIQTGTDNEAEAEQRHGGLNVGIQIQNGEHGRSTLVQWGWGNHATVIQSR